QTSGSGDSGALTDSDRSGSSTPRNYDPASTSQVYKRSLHRQYDVLTYNISASFDWSTATLSATAVLGIELQNTSNMIALDAGNTMKISAVRDDHGSSLVWSRGS